MNLTNLDMTDWPAWLRESLHIRSWPCPVDIRIVVAVDLRPVEAGGPVLRFSLRLLNKPVFNFLTLSTGLTETEIHRLLESLASQVRAMAHMPGTGAAALPGTLAAIPTNTIAVATPVIPCPSPEPYTSRLAAAHRRFERGLDDLARLGNLRGRDEQIPGDGDTPGDGTDCRGI